MASRATNEAVERYRKQVLREFDREIEEDATAAALGGLSKDEFEDYVRLTTEIDTAADDARERVENYAPSTAKQVFHQVVNGAGLDREGSNA